MDQNFIRGLRGYLRAEFIKVLDYPHPVIGQAWYPPTTVGSRGDLIEKSLLDFGQHSFGYSGSEREQSFGVGFYAHEMGRSLGWTPDGFSAQMKTNFDTLCAEKNECGYAGRVISFHESWFQAGRDAVAHASTVMEECLTGKDTQGTPLVAHVADVFRVMTLGKRYVHPNMILGPGPVTVHAARENRHEIYDLVYDHKKSLRVDCCDVGAGKEGYLNILRDKRPYVGRYDISREECLAAAFREGVTYAALVLRQEPSKDSRVNDLLAQERAALAGMAPLEKLAC